MQLQKKFHKQTPVILLCLAIATLISACNDNDSPPASEQLIPLQKNNMWVYNDFTVYTEDQTTRISTDTVTITESHTSNDTTWWTVSKPFNNFIQTQNFITVADTVYNIQYRGTTSTEYFSIPSNGPFTYQGHLDKGDADKRIVRRLSTPVTTPAGTFYPCYEYTYRHYNGSLFNITETVTPGVGVIKVKTDGFFGGFAGSTPFKYTRTLIKYALY